MVKTVTVTLPDIGEGVVEGEVVEWLKNVGEPLSQDEPVVVVMTDKATVELPSPHPGILAKQYCKVGETAILKQPLYDVEVAGDVSQKEKSSIAQSFIPTRQKEKPSEAKPKQVLTEQKALATPPVRQLAKDMGLDINSLTGTGKEGRVTENDLRQSLKTPAAAVTHLADDEEKLLKGIPGMMAKKMAESKRIIPHFSFHEKADATRLIKLRENFKREGLKEGIQVTYMPFFIRALSLTIRHFPMINSSYDPSASKLFIHQHHHIGVAMSTEQGLIVPVLKNTQEMTLAEIIRTYDALKKNALEGKLHPGDLKGSTITISNYGVLGGGGLWATPIINYPEAAILAVNKIQKQAVVKNDKLVVLEILNLSWSFDHRFIDGDLAAKVSGHFTALVQNPAQLI